MGYLILRIIEVADDDTETVAHEEAFDVKLFKESGAKGYGLYGRIMLPAWDAKGERYMAAHQCSLNFVEKGTASNPAYVQKKMREQSERFLKRGKELAAKVAALAKVEPATTPPATK